MTAAPGPVDPTAFAPAAAVAVAGTLEALVGEPPDRLHPVAWFGRLVAPLDGPLARPGLVGLLGALSLPLGAGAVAGGLVSAVAALSVPIGAVLAGVALFATSSLARLLAAARAVVAASDADLARARERLPALVGRDPADLTPGEVRSAAVESAAENLADGLVAPLTYFVAGAGIAGSLGAGVPAALAAGAAGAAWCKAVNTMDSMLGYRGTPTGRAPARLDDLAMWVPARLTALGLAVLAGRPAAVRTARALTDDVASPNAGWPMGVTAAAHDLRLSKPGAYDLDPGGELPSAAEADRAIRTVAWAGALTYPLAALALAAGPLLSLVAGRVGVVP